MNLADNNAGAIAMDSLLNVSGFKCCEIYTEHVLV